MGESGGLFVIDAETGDTSQFTSVTQEGSCTFTATTGSKDHGSYGFDLEWDGVNNDCYGAKTLSPVQTDFYVRAYFIIESGFSVPSQYNSLGVLEIRDGTTYLVSFKIARIASGTDTPVDRWLITGQSLSVSYLTTNFSLGVWHYVEIHWKQGTGADGGAEIWVDGDSIYSDLDNDLTGYSADSVVVGSVGHSVPDAGYLYYDDIKADTSYVGAYSAGGGGRISRYHDLSGLGAHGQLAFNPLS